MGDNKRHCHHKTDFLPVGTRAHIPQSFLRPLIPPPPALVKCHSSKMTPALASLRFVSLGLQNHSENVVHGADIPEEPRGLPLHRLRLQHHAPPHGGAAPVAVLGPAGSRVPQLPSALGGTADKATGSSSKKLQSRAVCHVLTVAALVVLFFLPQPLSLA